jgi:hypothetical protein
MKPLVGMLTLAVILLAPGAGEAASELRLFDTFTTVDPSSGLFEQHGQLFPLVSATYVQPQEGKVGANAGPIELLGFDLMRLCDDFRQMRETGVGAIYMRVGAGFFLNPDGSWRRPEDPYSGVIDAQTVQKETLARLAQATKTGSCPFTFNYEIFDFLLTCAEAEGLYVVPMIMDNWSKPRKYDLEEKLTSILYPDVWQKTIDDWVKILGRLSGREVILGYLIEGETLALPPWNKKQWRYLAPGGPILAESRSPLEAEDPELARQFRDFLRARYGNSGSFKVHLRHGYNREQAAYDPETGVPEYPFEAGVFEHIERLDDVPLPTVERAKGDVSLGPGAHFPWWLNVPFDPLWVEFGYFKEWLYTERLNGLVDRLREVCPNALFFHSAAWDYVPVWHPFFVAWNHGELDCEVSLHGGGYPQSLVLRTTPKIEPHETVVELYQSVGCYRPFTYDASLPFAYGMGEGGIAYESSEPGTKDLDISETVEDAWNTALLMDNFGGGSAFGNLWDWGMFVGATRANPQLHLHAFASTVKKMAALFERDTFLRGRNAKVLILANGPALHSIMKELSANNIIALSSALAAAHCDFDIATTDEVSIGPQPGKVDLERYQAVFMPQLFQIPQQSISGAAAIHDAARKNVWLILGEWLDAAPNRLLCLGTTGLRDPWFNPLDRLPADVRALTGDIQPGPLTKQTGKYTWTTVDGARVPIVLTGVYTQAVAIQPGAEASVAPFLKDGDALRGTLHQRPNGSRTYFFGFPLGLSWMYLHDPALGGGRLNQDFDLTALASFYAQLLREAGVASDYEGDPDVVAYISDHSRVVMVRRRMLDEHMARPATIASPLLASRVYGGAESKVMRRGEKNSAEVTIPLEENRAAMVSSIGGVELLSDGVVHVATKQAGAADGEHWRVSVDGDVPARFSFGERPSHVVEYKADAALAFDVLLSADGTAKLEQR